MTTERKPRFSGSGPRPSEYLLFAVGDEHAAALSFGGEPAAALIMQAALAAARAERERLRAEASEPRAQGWQRRLETVAAEQRIV